MDKPIVHYRDVVTPVCVGHSAVVWPVDHPSDLVSNVGPVRTSPAVCVTEGLRGPLFETRNTYYKPHGDTPMNINAPGEYEGFGAFIESLKREPETCR
jgi:hypothetical protein